MMLWTLFTVATALAVVLSILYAHAERKAARTEHMLRTEISILSASREGLRTAYEAAVKERDFYREDNLALHQRYDGVECLTVEAQKVLHAHQEEQCTQEGLNQIVDDLASEVIKQIKPKIFFMRSRNMVTGDYTYIATLNLYNKRGELPYARTTFGHFT
jgi:hypothetical protein